MDINKMSNFAPTVKLPEMDNLAPSWRSDRRQEVVWENDAACSVSNHVHARPVHRAPAPRAWQARRNRDHDVGHAASGPSQWLWIEANTVTALQVVGAGQPSKRIVDRAVLTLDGSRGELRWPSGQCNALSVDPERALRPDFRRLVHQHLN